MLCHLAKITEFNQYSVTALSMAKTTSRKLQLSLGCEEPHSEDLDILCGGYHLEYSYFTSEC
jgi:hypothetical protein